MKTLRITGDQSHEMQMPFLTSEAKKRLKITGYQFLRGWSVEFETDAAYKIAALNETGTAVEKDIEEVDAWIPQSQTIIFETQDDDDFEYFGEKLIFVKTWLYNKNKSQFNLNEFKNCVY